jgi:hypothetical protein
VIQYKRAQLEKWAPYLNNNGLMCRLTTYQDLECKRAAPAVGPGRAMGPWAARSCSPVLGMVGVWASLAWLQEASFTAAPPPHPGTKILEIKEWYQNREDMLELKHINKTTGLNVDYFKPGHSQALRSAWTP